MNESMPKDGKRRGPTWVQAALVVLPVGTVVLGLVAMVMYFVRDGSPAPGGGRSRYGQEPSLASVSDSLRKLGGPLLGIRGVADENARRGLAATLSMIEGTLGETNLGYRPEVEEFEAAGFGWRNLWAEARGTRNPTEIIEVRASLDRPAEGPARPAENTGLAAALELAQAFAATSDRRTIRFVFLGNHRNRSAPPPRGEDIYRAQLANRAFKTMAVIDLDGGDLPGDRFLRPDGTVDEASLLAAIRGLEENIQRLANQ